MSAGSGWHNEDIAECGTDVTSKYISAPPGLGTWLTKSGALLNSPWVLRVLGGVALLVFGLVIKQWFV